MKERYFMKERTELVKEWFDKAENDFKNIKLVIGFCITQLHN